ncbi:MAG: hypothetical protein QXU92_04380 [Candidatus Diapherotrites archaeon]
MKKTQQQNFFEQLEKLSKEELDKMKHKEEVYRTMFRKAVSKKDIERIIDLEMRMLACSFPLIKEDRYT